MKKNDEKKRLVSASEAAERILSDVVSDDLCLIHSTRVRVLTWMVCDLDPLYVVIDE